MLIDEALLAAKNNGNCDEDCCMRDLAAEVDRLRAELAQAAADKESGAMAYDGLVKQLATRNAEIERLRADVKRMRDALAEREEECETWYTASSGTLAKHDDLERQLRAAIEAGKRGAALLKWFEERDVPANRLVDAVYAFSHHYDLADDASSTANELLLAIESFVLWSGDNPKPGAAT